jgi:hypothetical protein
MSDRDGAKPEIQPGAHVEYQGGSSTRGAEHVGERGVVVKVLDKTVLVRFGEAEVEWLPRGHLVWVPGDEERERQVGRLRREHLEYMAGLDAHAFNAEDGL